MLASDPSPSSPGPVPDPNEIRTSDLPSRTLFRGQISGGHGSLQWDPPSVETVARLFPRYEVVNLVGRGGMGVVYKARQAALDRWVAIKLLPAEVSQDESFRKRFQREAQTLAHLNHPRIITAHDFGMTDENHSYIVMEFVEGKNLHSIISGHNLPPNEAVQIIADVCEGLAYAHEQGVIHRDIKPANVLVDRNGRAKIADFGIARLSDPHTTAAGQTTHVVFGTPDYMAPEQFVKMLVDHRADLYALGVILYEVFCHDLPRGNPSPPSVRVGADKRVDRIVAKAMQNDPTLRYQSAREMLADVQRIRAGNGTTRAQPRTGGKTRSWNPFRGNGSPRRRWAVAACLLLAVAGFAVWRLRPPSTGPIPNLPPIGDSAANVAPNAWHDWLVEEQASIPGTLRKDGDYYVPQIPLGEQTAQFAFGPELRDEYVRVTLRFTRRRPHPQFRIYLRTAEDHDWGYASIIQFNPRVWYIAFRNAQGSFSPRGSASRPATVQDSEDGVMEFRAVADKLTFLFNGEPKITGSDWQLTSGRAAIYFSEGVAIRKLEWMKPE